MAGEAVTSDGNIVQVDGSIRNVPACSHPHFDADGTEITGPARGHSSQARQDGVDHTYTGWLEDFNMVMTGGITWLSNTFTVPPNPSSNQSQDVAFFGGIENSSTGSEIIQPVLDYGDGTYHWQVRAENCCNGGRNYYSPYYSVNVGDTIDGYVYPESNTNCLSSQGQWFIGINVNGSSEVGYSTCSWDSPMNWAFGGVLEVHNLSSCSGLPYTSGGESFSNISVYVNGSPATIGSWNTYTPSGLNPECYPGAWGSGSSGGLWWQDS